MIIVRSTLHTLRYLEKHAPHKTKAAKFEYFFCMREQGVLVGEIERKKTLKRDVDKSIYCFLSYHKVCEIALTMTMKMFVKYGIHAV